MTAYNRDSWPVTLLTSSTLPIMLSTVSDPGATWPQPNTVTHTHPFNGPLSGTTRVSQYQKGKTDLDFTEARDSEWQWHQLGCMQACTSLQTDNHASTPPLKCFTGRMPFLPHNQQRQSTEGMYSVLKIACHAKITLLVIKFSRSIN